LLAVFFDMTARSKEKYINLLPKDKFSSSTLGRILTWLLSTFRFIVIAVEMVVMLAFLSRFWLDSKNSDLNDEIEQKQAQITASSQIENEFRDIQKRLSIYQGLISTQPSFSNDIKSLTNLIPEDTVLSSISLSEAEDSLSGTSASEKSIAQLIANLQNMDGVKDVSVAQISANKDDPTLIDFNLLLSKEALAKKKT